MPVFPTPGWIQALMDKLNADARYAEVARNWEGDMLFQIDPGGSLTQATSFYLDLWHGKCREAYLLNTGQVVKPAFTLRGPYENYVRLLKAELEPLQALMTRKLSVQGNFGLLMRSVPTVLDFVRCCREVTDGYQ
jgi:putative sterol carrier protein